MDTSRGTAPVPLRIGRRQDTTEQVLTPGREMVIAATQPSPGWRPSMRAARWPGRRTDGVRQRTKLGIAVERVNRYGATKLRVGDATDARIPISGQFQGGDTDAFVEGVTAIVPGQGRYVDGCCLIGPKNRFGNA